VRGEVRLGRITGVTVAVHWSVVVILLLFSWSLATVSLPDAAPGYTDGAYWVAGVGATLLLLASLTAHELAHSLVARRAGIEVEGLTLWLFGGVTRLHGEAPTPGADFRIAAVGPATSLVLGGAFGAVAVGVDAVGVSQLVAVTSWWLAATNVLLGLFNLIPGAPLDGGRVLRAYLWHRRGDKVAAATSAAAAGRVVGFGLAGVGVLELLAGGTVGGLWLVLIGWFLISAAGAEESQVLSRQLLAGVRVADVMTPDPETAPGWLTIDAFVDQHVLGRQHSAYPVCGLDGEIEGLVTLAQLRTVPPSARATTYIREVAIPRDHTPTAEPEELLVRVLERGSVATGGRVLVLGSGRLVGILSRADVARMVEVRALAGSRLPVGVPAPDPTSGRAGRLPRH